jgi:PKD repeat protein
MRIRTRQRTVTRSLLAATAVIAIGLIVPRVTLRAQAGAQGQWITLPALMPINPVHVTLMHTGKVLVVSGSGNVATETNFRAAVWDPQTDTLTTQPLLWDMFCNGMVVLSDGRPFVIGGNLQYDPFHGHRKTSAFDPATETFTDSANMAHGRWYPTPTVLGDGSVMTFSGLSETGSTNTAVEIYTPGSGWSVEYPAGWTPPLYPRMHLLPNGKVFYSGSGRGSRLFDPVAKTWSAVVATTNYGTTRTYGTSVLLPLMPANGYAPRVMIFGGGNPATATTEIIDPSASTPSWQYGPNMSQPRIQMNATLLPSGKVLLTGGSLNDEDAATASLNADLYDPNTNTFTSAGANVYPRLYHSNALLLPDATVLLNGGNPQRGNYQQRQEIYRPAYLFNGDSTLANRPTISSVNPAGVRYGSTFQIFTADAADIFSVVLIRPGSPTHAFDQDQRFVGLSFTADNGVLNVAAPPNGNVAPPGYYMLFILNSAGVPSVATFVQLTASTNQPPTATITDPLSNVTINPGDAVQFAGSGSDPDGNIAGYSWTFAGGNPGASSSATPGTVTYSTPGVFTASLSVTDNEGLASQAATRTVTVSDFSLSATPSSRTVMPGGTAGYSATITGANQFTGTVAINVTGLPAGATAAFVPDHVTGSGSTALTVATSSSTPVGSYQLTITGTSGTLTRSTTVTLVVNADFSLTINPASRTIKRGNKTTYTVGATPGLGFSGLIKLTVSGLPRSVTGKFSPPSISGSGSSVLTIDTNKNSPIGSHTLTVTGTAGSVVRTTNVILVIQ